MDSRKELKAQYQSRTRVGGVYSITCAGSGRVWLKASPDLKGHENRFGFFISTGACPEPAMKADWDKYGPGSFSFAILETLEKKEDQTEAEFSKDVQTLLELWKERQGEA